MVEAPADVGAESVKAPHGAAVPGGECDGVMNLCDVGVVPRYVDGRRSGSAEPTGSAPSGNKLPWPAERVVWKRFAWNRPPFAKVFESQQKPSTFSGLRLRTAGPALVTGNLSALRQLIDFCDDSWNAISVPFASIDDWKNRGESDADPQGRRLRNTSEPSKTHVQNQGRFRFPRIDLRGIVREIDIKLRPLCLRQCWMIAPPCNNRVEIKFDKSRLEQEYIASLTIQDRQMSRLGALCTAHGTDRFAHHIRNTSISSPGNHHYINVESALWCDE